MNDEEDEGTHERGDSGKYCVIVTFSSLKITFEHLWVDLCDFGEADFVRLRSGRAGSWSFCRSARKIYFKPRERGTNMSGDQSHGDVTMGQYLVLAGIFGIWEDELARGKEVFPAIIYTTGSKDLGAHLV
jgi:hypothetical protein